ncbi:MAG: hypothetical protein IT435_02410 [Phycisphaerales bacterium]|nr:hypothetical protein [Phycisphaerales bacterium]
MGNILTTITRTIDIYNASLTEPHDLEQFINNAGAGTSILDLPPLPYTIAPQESLLLTLEVTSEGAPTIDTTLDFDTDESYLLSIPITGTRIVMLPFEPEAPMVERLLFLTDALEAKDGTEQRVSLRLAPRQEFDLTLMREDGVERQRVDFLMFDWSSRVFGLPIWIEPSFVTANITAGQTSVSVDDTTLADFRADGLAIIYESETKFDALEIDSVGPTTINFKTPISNNYSVGDGIRVMPLRTAIISQSVREKKWAVNLAQFTMTMRVLDNDVDLSSTSGWPTYNSKVLLSDANAIDTTLDGEIERRVEVFDSGTGKFSQDSTWDRARHGSAKTFLTRTRASLWSVRRLLHALRGQQVSFYLPTFTKDVSLAVVYTSGGVSMTIFNVGYTKYARQRTPKVDVRIVLKSGVSYTRTITASAEVDTNTEQITLSSSIAATFTPDQVERIEFLEKVRIDGDTVVIEHRSANGEAKIGFPVKGTLE